jgi:hypothetical protein
MKYLVTLFTALAVALLLTEPVYALNFGTTNNFRTFSSAHANANALGVGVGIGGGGGYGGGGIGYISTPRNAPMAYAPPAYPTATCLKAYSGGGSGLTFGFSAGVTVVDTECRIFEGMRALVNAKLNGALPREVVDRMMMDITCDAETMATTRDCKKHLAMREGEDNETALLELDTKVAEVPTTWERKW